MNKIFKLTLIMLIGILLIFNIPLYSNAISLDEILDNGDSFLNAGDSSGAIAIDPNGKRPKKYI